jgi:hypothetical protein
MIERVKDNRIFSDWYRTIERMKDNCIFSDWYRTIERVLCVFVKKRPLISGNIWKKSPTLIFLSEVCKEFGTIFHTQFVALVLY